ncbi:pentapeptide repeat-containing protein [Streptomyces mirabilis]|uniref:pentapeptide repeat-containing protein n=1 Tax=Streptomyces mirabilis TaxID=68239 RepID=UPI0037F247F2
MATGDSRADLIRQLRRAARRRRVLVDPPQPPPEDPNPPESPVPTQPGSTESPDEERPAPSSGQPGDGQRADWGQRIAILANAVTAPVAIAALLFTGISSLQAREELRNRNRELNISEQGQVTERFAAATEQLGSDAVDVRLGGIYSLQRIMKDSPPDRVVILEVLTAFIRTHAVKPKGPNRGNPPKAAEDAKAAAKILVERPLQLDVTQDDFYEADLNGVYLVEMQLFGANLAYAQLDGADLRNTKLGRARLEHARLAKSRLNRAYGFMVQLREAVLDKADASDAKLVGADLTSASLNGADLRRVDLSAADLHGASLKRANLQGATFFDTQLSNAALNGALLDKADMMRVRGLTVDQILEARPTATTKLPPHIARDARVKARIRNVERGLR